MNSNLESHITPISKIHSQMFQEWIQRIDGFLYLIFLAQSVLED